jgi:integrase
MQKRNLTDRGIQAIKPSPTGQRRIVWDALVPNLGLRISPSGHRSFVLVTRYPGQVHPASRSLGQYGKISLEDARAKAREWHRLIAQGRDPALERGETFSVICEEYYAREGGRLRSAKDQQSRLARLVLPTLGPRPINEIKRSEIIRLLDQVEDTSGPEAAHHCLNHIARIMSWYASRHDTFQSPIIKGMGRSRGIKRDRVLSDPELRAVWAAAEGPFGRMIRFILLTGARRNEAAQLHWREIEGRLWTLPSQRNKVGVELARPLSDAALAELGPRGDGFTFGGRRPVAGFSQLKRVLDERSGVTAFTIHDCRRTSRTLMSRAGVPSEVSERMLGHLPPGVENIYNRHRYVEEMAQGYQALANLILHIVEPQDNVVAIGAGR